MIDFSLPPKIAKPALILPKPPDIIRPGDPRHVVPGMFIATGLSGFGAGGAPLWTPAQISPRLWLDAELSSKTLSGSDVSQWDDLSGNAIHATSSARPTYSSADKWLDFESSDNMAFGSTIIPTGNAAFTAFAVLRIDVVPTSNANYYTILRQGTGATNQLIDMMIGCFPGPFDKVGLAAFSSTTLTGSTTLSINTDYIIMWQYTGSNFVIRLNGASDGSTAYSSANISSSSPSIPRLDGKLRTVLTFTSALSQANYEKVEGYLAHLWGLSGSLASGHPYKSAPPTLD